MAAQEPDLTEQLRAILEVGSSLIVGTIADDGTPFATRGWALDVPADETTCVRVVLGAGEVERLGPLGRGGWPMAVTGADVRTLRSVQVKGTVVRLGAADDDDRARAAVFCARFFDVIEEVDGTPRELMARLVPVDLVACVLEVAEVYDQTPGPGAGAPVPA